MLTLCLAAAVISQSSAADKQTPGAAYRWFLLSTNLQQAENLDKAIKAVGIAKDAGYNGVVFQDSSLTSKRTFTPAYRTALERVMGESRRSGMEFIPSLLLTGGPSDLLSRDASIVESMPYRGVRFLVTNGQLKPSEPPIMLQNGGFDAFAGEYPANFKGTHGADVALFNDTAEKHGGASSFRIEGQQSSQPGKGGLEFEQVLTLRPWHQYRATLWTKGAGTAGSIVTVEMKSSSGQLVGTGSCQAPADWGRNDLVFDSMGDPAVTVAITVQPTSGAKIWLDDLAIADVGLLNLTHRDDCPIAIAGDDGVIYNEGVDVAPYKDPQPAGTASGAFDILHDAALPTLMPNSRLHEGQSVMLDYYAASIVNGAPSICFNEAKTKSLLKSVIQRTMALTRPHFIFLDLGECRSLGWDAACDQTGSSAGGILANLLRNNAAYAKSLDPNVQIVTSSTMFDPDQGAKEQEFMLKGGVTESFKGLGKGMIVANSNIGDVVSSLSLFSKIGVTQVLWGSPDAAGNVSAFGQWWKSAAGTAGVKGFVYVPTADDYTHMADFARATKAAP